jgi:hypothetical protein
VVQRDLPYLHFRLLQAGPDVLAEWLSLLVPFGPSLTYESVAKHECGSPTLVLRYKVALQSPAAAPHVGLHFSHNQQFRTKKGFHYCSTGKCVRHKLSVSRYHSQGSQFAWSYVRLVWREHLQNKTHAKRPTAQSETWLRMIRYDPLIVPKVSKGNRGEQCECGLGNLSLNTNLSIAQPVGYLTEQYRYPLITTLSHRYTNSSRLRNRAPTLALSTSQLAPTHRQAR